MLKLKDLSIIESKNALDIIPEGKFLINTTNAHSFNVTQKDFSFTEVLEMSAKFVVAFQYIGLCNDMDSAVMEKFEKLILN